MPPEEQPRLVLYQGWRSLLQSIVADERAGSNAPSRSVDSCLSLVTSSIAPRATSLNGFKACTLSHVWHIKLQVFPIRVAVLMEASTGTFREARVHLGRAADGAI